MNFKKVISAVCAVSVFAVSALSVSAAKHTPSVTQKDTAVVSAAVDKNGNEVEVIVTPVSKNTSEDLKPEAKQQLDAAFEEIKSVDSLKDLSIVGDNPFKDKKEEYVVSNLFDVSLKGQVEEDFFKDGNTVTVTFSLSDVSTDVDSVWLHRASTDNKWHEMDVKKSGTNTYTATFTSFSPVAVCVPESVSGANNGGMVSPKTNDTTNYVLYIAVAACVPVLIAVAVFSRKKYREQ